MLSEEHILPSESSPFTIRQFVSNVRCKDFSKCWPFSHRILERCLMLGMKVELPPLEPTLKSHICSRCSITTKLPLDNGPESIVSRNFGYGSRDDSAKFDSKDSPKASRDPAVERVFVGDAKSLNMVVEKVGVNMREHFLAAQKPIKAAEIKASAEKIIMDQQILRVFRRQVHQKLYSWRERSQIVAPTGFSKKKSQAYKKYIHTILPFSAIPSQKH